MSHVRGSTAFVLALLALAACTPPPPPSAPTPAPVVQPTPPAERAAPPVEHALHLCALAPDSVSGLGALDAVVVDGRPDTLVVRDGKRIPLAEALPRVRLPEESFWFQARRTFDVPVGKVVQRYAIYDVGRVIDPADLAYLGTLERMPVFAAVSDVAPVQAELTGLLANERDLATLLLTNTALRTRFRAIDVLYVPLHATGCVFQPLLRSDTP